MTDTHKVEDVAGRLEGYGGMLGLLSDHYYKNDRELSAALAVIGGHIKDAGKELNKAVSS